MDNIFNKIISYDNFKTDHNGILISDSNFIDELKTSKKAWDKIYNYSLIELKKDRVNFDKNKLDDHLKYINKYYNFNKKTIFLEIGCGPAHIGEYVMKKFDSYFIGIDFNYELLLTLKEYFDEKGYKKYLLIYGDINNMLIKDNSVDFIYGGGVIEHFSDTNHILKESYRILKRNGVSFNTVPSFNLLWPLKFYYNIPSLPWLKNLFELIHIGLLKNKILENKYGYELSFTKNSLIEYYKQNGFKDIYIESLAIHPSDHKLKNQFIRDVYFKMQKNSLTTAFYLVCGKK